jgi:ribonuclease HII
MLRLERLLWDLDYVAVAGVDEVGLGPLAGPVVAAAVVFPRGCAPIEGVDDSKKLSARRRENLDAVIRERAAAMSLGVVEVDEVDGLGVHEAGLEAMRRAVVGLSPAADFLLVDARRVPRVSTRQSAYVKGDSFIFSVAAASIVAKVYRDGIMRAMETRFPGYGFGQHMGYGTASHMTALECLGPCPIHRRSFEPVRRLLGAQP